MAASEPLNAFKTPGIFTGMIGALKNLRRCYVHIANTTRCCRLRSIKITGKCRCWLWN